MNEGLNELIAAEADAPFVIQQAALVWLISTEAGRLSPLLLLFMMNCRLLPSIPVY